MRTRFKPYKRDAPYSYALGVLPTLELLRLQPARARAVLLSADSAHNCGVARIRELCAARNIAVAVDDRALRRLSPAGNCYAAGVFDKPADCLSPAHDQLVLVNPDDLGNLGTIMRTMRGYGLSDLAVILPAADPFHPRAVRASMGALFGLRCACFADFAAYRRSCGHPAYAFMTDGARQLTDVAFAEPCALIFGNEGRGLAAEFAHCAQPVRIEQGGAIDSLNLAVAAGIALHQLFTQRITTVRPLS